MKGDLLTQVGGLKNPSMQIIGEYGWLEVGYDWTKDEWEYYWDGPRATFDPPDESTPIRLRRLLYELDAAYERCGIRRGKHSGARMPLSRFGGGMTKREQLWTIWANTNSRSFDTIPL